jgi:predicted ribosome quality control (RQC) complex YloA/Tae2 family protein
MSLRAPEAERLLAGPLLGLEGAALQGARQPRWDSVVLSLRAPGVTSHLLLVARPGAARFHTVDSLPPNPQRPHAFQGLLRARLRGPLHSVSLRGGDRLLELRFGDLALLLLFAGQKTDLVLVDETDHVLGSLLGNTKSGSLFCWEPKPSTGIVDRFQGQPNDSLNEAVRVFFDEFERSEEERKLHRRVNQYRKGLLKRIRKQKAEADRGELAEQWRHQADLLRSSFHKIVRGASLVEVDDWSSGSTLSLPLEPALSPADNLERYYRRASRAERSGKLAAKRLEASQEELAALDRGELPDGLSQPVTPKRTPKGNSKKAVGRLPYRSWKSPCGFEIRVGRGATDNDKLTFRHAQGNDVWLHVRGRPGAHVVIRRPGAAPTPELLILAAQLALKFSGLKPGATEEVTWTRVKHIRKPKGLPPGKVLIRGEKVLYVRFSPEALNELVHD